MFRRILGARPLLVTALLIFGASTGLAAPPEREWNSGPSGSAPVSGSESTAKLEQALKTLSEWVTAKRGKLSLTIVDIESGAIIAERNSKLALNPASNMKLLTAAAVLELLGPGYRFSTGLYGKRQESTIAELTLRGHGDPSFQSGDLWRMSSVLASSGIEQVGKILVDQSRFDEEFTPPAFGQQPNEWAPFRAPVSAVALDENTVTLNVQPRAVGESALTWFEPGGFVTGSGLVETRATGSGQDVRWTLAEKNGRLLSQVAGHAATGLPRLRFSKRLADPRLVPGAALKSVLERLNVKVGPVELGNAGPKNLLVFHESATLATLLAALGKDSNNFYAEMLLKVLGAETAGSPASSAAGAAQVRAWLASHDADSADTKIVNGSGLFDANRVSSFSMARALAVAYANPALGPEYVAHLAVGGVDGTLRSRFEKYKRDRRIRAKTGTLQRTAALSGYILPGIRRPRAIAFSIIVDQVAGAHAESRKLIDAVVAATAD